MSQPGSGSYGEAKYLIIAGHAEIVFKIDPAAQGRARRLPDIAVVVGQEDAGG